VGYNRNMTVEAPLINIPDPKVEVIAEKRKTRRKARFDRFPSSVEGIGIIAEPGTRPIPNKRRLRRLQADSDRVARLKRYEVQAGQAKSRLVQAATVFDGFRGIYSERGGYDAPIVPSDKVIYDSNKLRESTGEYHRELIREEGGLDLRIPFESSEDGRAKLATLAQSIALLMIESGFDPDALGALITPSIVQRLDEERLMQLEAEGKVVLQAGTRVVDRTWSVSVNPSVKNVTPNRQK